MDPGESAEETCARETLEETGLEVVVTKLVGIYTSPDVIATYEDGNRWQSIGISFEAEVAAGDLQLSRETTDIGYFSIDLLDKLDLLEDQLERIQDAVINLPNAIMK
jgi:8-oxo-dGTP diphosphatase